MIPGSAHAYACLGVNFSLNSRYLAFILFTNSYTANAAGGSMRHRKGNSRVACSAALYLENIYFVYI